MTRIPPTARIQEAFFEGMRNGYITGIKGIPVRNMPGYRQVITKFENWKVTDMWIAKSHGVFSAGITTIFHKNTPVWFMSYEGWYKDGGALSFLKTVLSKAYTSEEFCGCRGASNFSQCIDGRFYCNRWDGSFKMFKGIEKMYLDQKHLYRSRKKVIGMHTYRGMILQ